MYLMNNVMAVNDPLGGWAVCSGSVFGVLFLWSALFRLISLLVFSVIPKAIVNKFLFWREKKHEVWKEIEQLGGTTLDSIGLSNVWLMAGSYFNS